MVIRTFRGAIQVICGLGAGLAILLLLLAWRLSAGPISLAFLSPYVAGALSAATPGYGITFDDTILTWAGWERSLDIRVVNVRAVDADGTAVAGVPELSLSLSAKGLMEGRIAPQSIELFGPHLTLVRHEDGRFEVGFRHAGTTPEQSLMRGLDDILTAPVSGGALDFLTRVDIVDADVTIDDQRLQTVWRAPGSRVSLRRDARGIAGELTLDLHNEGVRTQLTVVIDYAVASGTINAGLNFEDVNPALFARVSPELAMFSGIHLAFRGTMTLAMRTDGVIEVIGFDLDGGAGRLTIPAPLAQDLAVEKVELRGRFEGEARRLEFDHVLVDLGRDGSFHLPAPTDHDMPMRSLTARGRLLTDTNRLEIAALALDLHGPKAELGIVVENLSGPTAVDAQGTLHNLPVDEFERYWPRAWGTDAQEWSVAHLSEGIARRVDAAVKISLDGKDVQVESLNGTMEIADITVDYLPPMPKAEGAGGTVKFDSKTFDIELTGARAKGLDVRKGRILFTGLDAIDQYVDIELFIDGPINDALDVIDSEPLRFASTLGIDPGRTGGTASTRLKMRFILEHGLTKDQVAVTANSELKDVSVSEVFLDRGIDGGRLNLQADNTGMDVTGLVVIGNLPASLIWRENFVDGSPFRSRYGLTGKIPQISGLKELGLDLAPVIGDFINGGLEFDVRFTAFEGDRVRVEGKVDLSSAALDLPAIGWSKATGIAADAEINLHLQNGQIAEVSRIAIQADDLRIDASALYDADGKGLGRVDFTRAAWGETDLKGWIVARDDGGWDVKIGGPRIDLEPLVGDALDYGSGGGQADGGPGPKFRLEADIGRVRLGDGRFVEAFKGNLVSDGYRWRQANLEARAGEAKRLALTIRESGKNTRALAVHADDAGATLRAFGYYENMIGGTLDLIGDYDDSSPSSTLKGRLEIRDYRVIKAPVLAHLVSILAITGIPAALDGEGLSFVELATRFQVDDDTVTITDARATGASLGFTASGTLDTAADTVQLEGTVVPAYLINAIWGRIPILGKLLTGGEEGGGVFAATYRMTGPKEKPKMTVNPLTALAPGFLRHLFDIFGSGESTSELPQKKERPPPP